MSTDNVAQVYILPPFGFEPKILILEVSCLTNLAKEAKKLYIILILIYTTSHHIEKVYGNHLS